MSCTKKQYSDHKRDVLQCILTNVLLVLILLQLHCYIIQCEQIGYGTKSLTCQDPKVLKKHLQSTTIMLGSEANDWSTSAKNPNWYDPATYIAAV
jgi:hypothetical protein